MGLKIELAQGRMLLQECGYDGAKEYSAARVKKKLEALPKALTDDNKPESKDSKKLLKALIEEMKSEEGEVTVTGEDGDTEEAAPAEKKEKKAEKKESKKATKEEEAEEDDEEEADDSDDDEDDDDEESDDDEDEEEEEKPAKKKDKKESKKGSDKSEKRKGPPASAGVNGGPGIIASIIEFLQTASSEKPLTKEKLLDKLEKRFPTRGRDAMKKTVNVQVPNRLKADKKMNVESVETKGGAKGYWVNPDKVESKSKSEKKAKKAKKEEADEDDD